MSGITTPRGGGIGNGRSRIPELRPGREPSAFAGGPDVETAVRTIGLLIAGRNPGNRADEGKVKGLRACVRPAARCPLPAVEIPPQRRSLADRFIPALGRMLRRGSGRRTGTATTGEIGLTGANSRRSARVPGNPSFQDAI